MELPKRWHPSFFSILFFAIQETFWRNLNDFARRDLTEFKKTFLDSINSKNQKKWNYRKDDILVCSLLCFMFFKKHSGEIWLILHDGISQNSKKSFWTLFIPKIKKNGINEKMTVYFVLVFVLCHSRNILAKFERFCTTGSHRIEQNVFELYLFQKSKKME